MNLPPKTLVPKEAKHVIVFGDIYSPGKVKEGRKVAAELARDVVQHYDTRNVLVANHPNHLQGVVEPVVHRVGYIPKELRRQLVEVRAITPLGRKYRGIK